MSTYPRELIFRERKDIDEFLSEQGLFSKLYEVLLIVREPAQYRYALKVSPLQILNEAYGQALRVIIDNHPEEDYYNNYFLNAKKYFERSYEAELVFCVVYVLLKFSNITTPNVGRFLKVIERRMEGKNGYFPEFLQWAENIISDPLYNPKTDRFFLHTDSISKQDLHKINWYAATNGYDEASIRYYLNFAVDLDYQIAILDSIYQEYDFNQLLADTPTPDIKPLIDGFKNACKKYTTRVSPIPVVKCDISTEKVVTSNDNSLLIAEIEKLKAENEELKKKREAEESEERVVKVKDVFELAKTANPSVKTELLNILRVVIANEDENWIERIKAELQMESGKNLVESKYRITARKTTDVIKIISTMFDMHLFSTPDGMLATSKQEVMENFGKLLGADLSNYSASLSAAKNTNNFMNTFTELSAKANEYYNS